MSGKTIAQVVGRLTRDAELKYTNGGSAVLHFCVANSERKKVRDEWQDVSQFWDVELWGKQAENLAQYLTKGKSVTAYGTMRQEHWEQEGVRRMKCVVTAQGVEFTGNAEDCSERTSERSDGSNYGQGANRSAQPSHEQPRQEFRQPAVSRNNSDDDFSDDIPF